MAGLSRPKDGVASLAYVPAIHVFLPGQDVDARHKAGHDDVECVWGRWTGDQVLARDELMAVRRIAPPELQPKEFSFTAENAAWAKKQIAKYPEGRQQSAIIPLLWRAQEQNGGWLPEAAIRQFAPLALIPRRKRNIESVASRRPRNANSGRMALSNNGPAI